MTLYLPRPMAPTAFWTVHCKFPARESLISDILAGDGKTADLFYSVCQLLTSLEVEAYGTGQGLWYHTDRVNSYGQLAYTDTDSCESLKKATLDNLRTVFVYCILATSSAQVSKVSLHVCYYST
jgi:hypothetical protein